MFAKFCIVNLFLVFFILIKVDVLRVEDLNIILCDQVPTVVTELVAVTMRSVYIPAWCEGFQSPSIPAWCE